MAKEETVTVTARPGQPALPGHPIDPTAKPPQAGPQKNPAPPASAVDQKIKEAVGEGNVKDVEMLAAAMAKMHTMINPQAGGTGKTEGLDKTIPGGRYEVDGEIVNHAGERIDDDGNPIDGDGYLVNQPGFRPRLRRVGKGFVDANGVIVDQNGAWVDADGNPSDKPVKAAGKTD